MGSKRTLDGALIYDYIHMVKLIYLCIFCMLLSCAPRRQTYTSVPALMEYKLVYPDEALERGLEGKALVSIVVTEEGTVKDATIHTSSGYPLLDSAAVKTAKTFIFSPAVVRGKPVSSAVLIPVEFLLKLVDYDTWIIDVSDLQDDIARHHRSEDIEELYALYKRLIYSTRFELNTDINYYIKEAVLGSTAQLWDGCWSSYPASCILFIDIMRRYPDSFVSIKAQADFDKYFREEAVRMRRIMPAHQAETLIARLTMFVDD